MALTYGFYNSLKGDRKYDAMQFSEIIDTLIIDGIIPSKGQLFAVTTAENGMQINVGTGMAWFFHSWTKNDSVMVLTVEESDITRPRIDAVVLEVDRTEEVRANAIKIVKGIPAVNAEKPTLLTTDKVHQYPLAYITVPAAAEEIKAENIENMVGRSPTVFATGVLETAPLDDLWNQWEGEWDTWFAAIKLQLSGDVVTNLQLQIDELKDGMKFLNEKFQVVEVVHNDVITTSQNWQNTTGSDLPVNVLVFGGGGGGGGSNYPSGGGGGHMSRWAGSVSAGASVSITIGTGGASGSSGGTTSFGTYVSANGGATGNSIGGGNGGTGGGGFKLSRQSGGKGGDASYGGGGGGGGGGAVTASGPGNSGGNGGKGGTYGGGGGGGGGGGAVYKTGSGWSGGPAGSGGAKGTNGGAGGSGGSGGAANNDGYLFGGNGKNGSPGSAGINTNALNLDFKGPGTAGSHGSGGTAANEALTQGYAAGGGGGGGGGGYGGRGGNGGSGSIGSYRDGISGVGGSGGGGGGYGANGASGDGTGGGGGGYGHSPSGPGGGGYGASGYGSGGSGSAAGKNGICIVVYTTREIVVS